MAAFITKETMLYYIRERQNDLAASYRELPDDQAFEKARLQVESELLEYIKESRHEHC